jgi:D-alanine-D-alanine ligase
MYSLLLNYAASVNRQPFCGNRDKALSSLVFLRTNILTMKRIAVLTGGHASELEISLKSAAVVMKNIDRSLFEPYLIEIREHQWMCTLEKEELPVDRNDFTVALPEGGKLHFDAVFLAIHGTPAEDGKLQAYLDLLSIPYTACGVLAAALSFDKMKCKQFLQSCGIPTAQARLFRPVDWAAGTAPGIAFPVFVKPNKNGSSFGAGMAKNQNEFDAAMAEAFRYDDEVVVEEYLQGTEVTCGVLGAGGSLRALPVTEIRSKKAFFDYEAKYKGFSEEITPAEISDKLTEQIQQLSVECYRHLGFKGICRVDFIIREEQPFMLEVNAIPGLSEESIIPQQARAIGISLPELFTIMLSDCIASAV